MTVRYSQIEPQAVTDATAVLITPVSRAETRLTGIILHNPTGVVSVAEFFSNGILVCRSEVQPNTTARPYLQINALNHELSMTAAGTLNVTGELYIRTDS